MRINLIALIACLCVANTAFAAVSCVVLTSGSDIDNQTTYTTASVTPSSNKLVLVAVVNSRNSASACTDADATTMTGNGLTYVKVAEQCFSSSGAPTNMLSLWRSMGATPSSGAITVGYSATSQAGGGWIVMECDGVDTSGTNGSGAVVQNASNLAEPGTSLTVSLAAFSDAANATLAIFGLNANNAITPEAGYTELDDVSVTEASNNMQIQAQYVSSNDTSPSASFSSADSAGIAIEIKADPAAPGAGVDGGGILWFQ